MPQSEFVVMHTNTYRDTQVEQHLFLCGHALEFVKMFITSPMFATNQSLFSGFDCNVKTRKNGGNMFTCITFFWPKVSQNDHDHGKEACFMCSLGDIVVVGN